MNVTSLLMADGSTSGLCIEQCARGTVLNQYVYNNFLSNLNSDQYLCQVSAHDEWPVIGVALGFPPAAGRNAGQPPRCGCIIAHRLQLLYNDLLRDFDQVYLDLNSPAARSRSSDQLPVLQSTEADHQTLFLASITSEPSVMDTDA